MPEKKPEVNFNLPEEKKRCMREDMEKIQSFKDYRTKFEGQMTRGAKVWNMMASPAPRDDISNIFIGIARMIGVQAVSSLTQGRPFFGFRPGAAGDFGKIPYWQAGVDHILNLSNFDAKQQYFFVDNVAIGMGIYECVPQMPMRKVRYKNSTGFEEVWKRDFRRSKFEVRHRSPFEVWLDPSAPNLDEVRVTYDEQYINESTWNRDYKHCKLPDGSYKYEYTDCVVPGYILSFGEQENLMYREHERRDKVVIGKIQDEDNDILRIYANGVPIYDGCLQIKENEDGTRTPGMNVLGVHSFCFGPNEHQYDENMRTHSLYPMGLPQTMRGFDALYQVLTNMTVDNYKLANTVAVSYEPFDGSSAIDLDSRDFYSGDYVDGKITPQSFGQSRLDLSAEMWNRLDNWSTYLTGTDFKQIHGDPAKTAYEKMQREKAQNKRYEHKIRVLENGCFKKLGQLCVSGVMSELTVEDMEELTEKEIEIYTEKIKKGEISGEDFETAEGKIKKRKVITTLRIPNRKVRENFGKSKKRKLDYDSTDNTLIDEGYAQHDSFMPAAKEYIWSVAYAEKGAIPDLYVDAQRNLGDDMDIKLTKYNAMTNYARARMAEDPEAGFDMDKIDRGYVRAIDLQEEDVMKSDEGEDETQKTIEQLEKLISTPAQDVVSAQPSHGLPPETNGQPINAGAARAFQPTKGVLESPLQGG